MRGLTIYFTLLDLQIAGLNQSCNSLVTIPFFDAVLKLQGDQSTWYPTANEVISQFFPIGRYINGPRVTDTVFAEL